MENLELIVDEQNHMFKFDINGEIAFITYTMRDGNVYLLNHTEVPKSLEGKGVAGKLVSQALDFIRSQGGTFVPRCSYIIAYIQRHPNWNDIMV